MAFEWFLFPLYAFLYLLNALQWVSIILVISNVTLKNVLLKNHSQAGSLSWHFKDSFSIFWNLFPFSIICFLLSGKFVIYFEDILHSFPYSFISCFPLSLPTIFLRYDIFQSSILSPTGKNIKHIHYIGTMLSNTTDLILTFQGPRDSSMLWPRCFQQKF